MALRPRPGVLGERRLAAEELLERGERHPVESLHRLEQRVRPRIHRPHHPERERVADGGEIAGRPAQLAEHPTVARGIVEGHPHPKRVARAPDHQAMRGPVDPQRGGRTRAAHRRRIGAETIPPAIHLAAGGELQSGHVVQIELHQIREADAEGIERLAALDLERQ